MAFANPNFNEIITTTIKNRRGALADNVTNNNVLLAFLNERGNIDMVDGGETLVEELDFAENETFKFYSGFEVIDISPQEVFSAAEFDWKQSAVTVTISGLDQRRNSGRNRTIRLLEARIKNAERSMENGMSTAIFSNGTAFAGKQIGGLQLLVADDPSTGVVGGIDRAAFSFWRNISFGAVADGGAAADATNIQGFMNDVWLDTVRGRDHVQLIVADKNFFNFFQQSLQTIQRITSATEGASGFMSLEFNGTTGNAPVFFDPNAPTDHMYFLNPDFIFFRVHQDANMAVLEERMSVNQDAIVVPIIWQGNMTLSNASLQGVLIA